MKEEGTLELTHHRSSFTVQDFSKFWSALSGSEFVKNTSEETDIVKWTFKDGTVLEVKQEEHSTINHYITYSIITSSPELSYSSVLSTIRCYPVTSGEGEGSTFVEWSGNFSSDADAGALPLTYSIINHVDLTLTTITATIQDAKFKRRDALADLAKAAVKN